MLKPLTFEEFQRLATHGERVAVFSQIPAGDLTPTQIYRQLKALYHSEGAMLEDLHERGAQRYSFICFKPITSFTATDTTDQQALTQLRQLQTESHFVTRDEVANLINKAVGFITYDAIRYFENIPARHATDSLPALSFHFYATSVTFDHRHQTILLSTLADTNKDLDLSLAYQQACDELEKMKIQILAKNPFESDNEVKSISSTVNTDTTDEEFMHMVEQAKAAIIRGDAFQIVISRRFQRPYSVAPFTLYQHLCTRSPAPFMFYLPTSFGTIIGASPERFVSVYDRVMRVNPIAGTRKRVKEKTNEMIEQELLHDQKEIAEHMMLVDLARNDVGAVSEPGSVQVDELLSVKHYSHVSHITSTVSGKLREKYDIFDAFFAAFPAGTLSGAPKIRAMELIDQIETSRRGLYGGAICRLDLADNLDSCIAIRMALLQDGIATIRAGAGIVYDSDPYSEAQETRHKAQAMLDAIAAAQGE